MKKVNLKKLLKIKKRMHVFAITHDDTDIAPVKAIINGIPIEFDNLEILSALKFWKDSKSAFAELVGAIKAAYDKAE